VPKPEKCTKWRAFTYLLLEESVANDVINVSLFAYDKITFKTLNVNKRRQDIDKKCLRIKTRRPASADRTARAANFRQDLEET